MKFVFIFNFISLYGDFFLSVQFNFWDLLDTLLFVIIIIIIIIIIMDEFLFNFSEAKIRKNMYQKDKIVILKHGRRNKGLEALVDLSFPFLEWIRTRISRFLTALFMRVNRLRASIIK